VVDVEKWNTRYRDAEVASASPILVLEQNAHLLPARGRALDLACGMGGNARLLAERGLETRAWDVSVVAVDKLNVYARQHGLPLLAELRDVEQDPPAPVAFDVIVVGHFLERRLAEPMIRALSLGGLLYYQTFIDERVADTGPRNPAYRLRRNELLSLFSGLRLLVYREEGLVGDLERGFRNEAMLVAMRD
jgi:SAM-dependent methyltransferase